MNFVTDYNINNTRLKHVFTVTPVYQSRSAFVLRQFRQCMPFTKSKHRHYYKNGCINLHNLTFFCNDRSFEVC